MPKNNLLHSLLVRGALAVLIVLASLTVNGNSQTQPEKAATSSAVKVTHVLGFEGVQRNLNGELLIQDQALHFQRDGGASAQVNLASIENIYVGEQDKQVGGVPLTLGKAAVPFGGGRVISLFSHKKYDSVVLEYRDSQGGFHGAIFRLPKGQGATLKDVLIAHGAHTAVSEDPAALQTPLPRSMKSQGWSIQVDRVDPGATTLDPSFSVAIYENLVRDLNKSKRFQGVFRSGDRSGNDPAVLELKTVVEKYTAGSETTRAVTTVAGATKLKVRVQLVTHNGNVVLNRVIDGNVRFLGDNFKATNKLAGNTAKFLNQSRLPATPAPMSEAGSAP